MKQLFVGILALWISSFPVLAQTQEEADAKFADQDWQGAADDYRILLGADDSNAQNWFSLASALHQLEIYDAARKAYIAAIDAGYPRAAQARFGLARVYMSLGRQEKALSELEEIAKTGGPNGRAIAATTEFAPLLENPRFLAVVKTLTPCTADAYRHFDFWLGEWDVAAVGNPQANVRSKISSKQDGCVILEEYSFGGSFTGMSINFYDSAKDVWHQTWMSNAGGSVYLEGGWIEGGAMQLSDKDLPISKISGTINRVTWTPNADGSVRQFWESSTDNGKTWTVPFDGVYTKKSAE